MRPQGRFPPPKLPGLIAALGLVACGQGPLEANGIPSHTFSITAGRESLTDLPSCPTVDRSQPGGLEALKRLRH